MLRNLVRQILLEALAPIDSKIISQKVWNKLFANPIRTDETGWQWKCFDPQGNRNYPSGRSDLNIRFSLRGYGPTEDAENEPAIDLIQGQYAKKEFFAQDNALAEYKDRLQKMLELEFTDFVARRGWNLLHVYVTFAQNIRPVYMVRLQIDANPHKSSASYIGTGDSLAGYLLLHMTDTKNINSIKRKGFIQSKKTSDNRRFGTTGRTYFLKIKKQEYNSHLDIIIDWFRNAPDAFAGTDNMNNKSIIVVDGDFLEPEARFYKDTEFGRQGSGIVRIPLEGTSAISPTAVYTTHQLDPMSIVQTFDL